MASKESDTTLLGRLKSANDPQAAQELWKRYFDRLARLARKKITARQRRVADEEDIALSAFNSFFRGVADGRFPRLDDRDDLWRILVMLAERKAVNQTRKHLAAKRGGGDVRGDSAFVNGGDSSLTEGLHNIEGGAEPTPEFVNCFSQVCLEMLGGLEDPELIQVALFKMEGYSNEEIAQEVGRVPRSIERKLNTIRKIWDRQKND